MEIKRYLVPTMHPRLLLSFLALFLIACPRPVATPTETLVEEIRSTPSPVEEISARTHSALQAQQENIWAQWTQGKALDVVAPMQKQEVLFAPATLRLIDEALAQTQDPLQRLAYARLKNYLASEGLSKALSQPETQIALAFSSATFQLQDQEYSVGEVQRMLPFERSAHRRRLLYNEASKAMGPVAIAIQKQNEAAEATLKSFGYESPAQFAFALRETTPESLKGLSETFLRSSEALYQKALDEFSSRDLNFPSDKLTRADLPRLFRSFEADELFPSALLWMRAEKTASSMGFDLAAMPQLRIDISDKPSRSPGSLTLALSIPQDVRVSLKPANGVREQGHLLHEMGHALQYATSKPLRFELSQLGSFSLRDTYAFLLEDLMCNETWLREVAGLDDSTLGTYLRAMSAHKLFRLRLAAARLSYQLSRWSQPNIEPVTLHQKFVKTLKVTRLAADDAHILLDSDERLETADLLQSRLMAMALAAELKKKFGQAWWKNPAASSYLKSLWTDGALLTGRELSAKLGGENTQVAVFIEEIKRGLETPLPLPQPPAATDGGFAPPQPFGTPKTTQSMDGGSR